MGKIQPAQKDRGEILLALLAANGGKMPAKDAWQQMRLPKNLQVEPVSGNGRYSSLPHFTASGPRRSDLAKDHKRSMRESRPDLAGSGFAH
jgi:hypothetical protein